MNNPVITDDNEELFFGKKNLLGYTYYYHLPNMLPLERKDLSEKITNFQGVRKYIFLKYIENFSFS